MFLCKGRNCLLGVCKGTRRWRQQSMDFAYSADMRKSHFFLSFAVLGDRRVWVCILHEYRVSQWTMVILMEIRVEVSFVLPSCHCLFAVRGKKSSTWHTSTLLSMQWWNHSIHWHSVIQISCFGFCQHTLVHISLPVSPSSQRGVSVSKLVVCYAGDFWGRGQL